MDNNSFPTPESPSSDPESTIDAVRAAVRADLVGASSSRFLDPRRVKLLILVVVVLVSLMVAPMFFIPSILKKAQTTDTSKVLADLTQFSNYQRGESADQSAVTYVEDHAKQTTTNDGTTWALAVGTRCYGVSTVGGVVSTPTVVAASYCA